MERAFIVSKESEYHKELNKYFDLQEQQRKFINKYFAEKGIEANAFIIGGNGFMNCSFKQSDVQDIYLKIEATENDLNKFEKMLCKANEVGLRRFKTKSTIGKDFAQRCIDEKIIINLWEPKPRDYFKSLDCLSYGIRRFFYNDILYLKINSQLLSPFETPEGFTEIKLSEFYSALEEVEKNDK